MTYLQWASIVAGFVSAVLWLSTFKSISMTRVSSLDGAPGGDGDMALQIEEGEMGTIIYRWSRVARFNAAAAALAGVAILLQSLDAIVR